MVELPFLTLLVRYTTESAPRIKKSFHDRFAPVGYAAEYLTFASSAVSLLCRGMMLQTTIAYFNLLVNPCQGVGTPADATRGRSPS